MLHHVHFVLPHGNRNCTARYPGRQMQQPRENQQHRSPVAAGRGNRIIPPNGSISDGAHLPPGPSPRSLVPSRPRTTSHITKNKLCGCGAAGAVSSSRASALRYLWVRAVQGRGCSCGSSGSSGSSGTARLHQQPGKWRRYITRATARLCSWPVLDSVLGGWV